MALVRNNLSMRMKGRAGSFSFYSSKGRQVVRVAQNSTNYGESARRSEAQQVRRVKWANLVNFYKLTIGTLHGAFETKRSNETDYNAFMRKNLPVATVALTKDQASVGCCAVQAFYLSEGSLPTITPEHGTHGSVTGYFLGFKAEPNSDMTGYHVSDFAQEIIECNSWAKAGMQISVITVSVTIKEEGPRSNFYRHEVTLDLEDQRDLASVWGIVGLKADANGDLYTEDLDTSEWQAVILSDSTSGQLKVSTSRLVPGDTSAEEEFSNAGWVAEAMDSYGVDVSRFLDSGDFKA